MTDLERAVASEPDFWALVDQRRLSLGRFLSWAAAREGAGPGCSLRFPHRSDVDRCRSVLPYFDEPWWGVVVYSCFDSTIGATAVAPWFSQPPPSAEAERLLASVAWPRGSVQHHRKQSGLRGARLALISACEKSDAVRDVLLASGPSFEDRFSELGQIGVHWWGRTTHFDLLARCGPLGVAGERYEPSLAHLAGATGPRKGFEQVWALPVTGQMAPLCEELLARWTLRWFEVAERCGVDWPGEPYTPADFENALCVFQEPHHPGLPDPEAFEPRSVPERPYRRGTGPSC